MAAIAIIRGVGLVMGAILTVAAALTVASVVRLALHARRDEIEIMQLVGAPPAYVRGPFVMEGVIQGGVGAIVALVALAVTFFSLRGPYLTPLARPSTSRPSISCRPSSRSCWWGAGCSSAASAAWSPHGDDRLRDGLRLDTPFHWALH